MLAAAVNIHHFILDGAIWKLRDGRVARILIRRETQPESALPASARQRWLAGAVYAAGALATLGVLGSLAVRQLAFEPALRRGDLGAAQRSLRRLDAFGYESAEDYRRVGQLAATLDATLPAQRALEHSLRLQPQPATYLALARVLRQRQGLASALPIFEAAVARYPNDADLMNQLALTYLKLDEPERAVPIFERLVQIVPSDETVRASLERARKRSAASPSPALPVHGRWKALYSLAKTGQASASSEIETASASATMPRHPAVRAARAGSRAAATSSPRTYTSRNGSSTPEIRRPCTK